MSASVDPRLRARRIGVTRGRARKRLRRLLVALPVVMLISAAVVVLTTPILGVHGLQVRGADSASADAVDGVVDAYVGTPVLRLDRAALSEDVRSVPGFSDATVSVSFTGTVTVTPGSSEPVAWVPTTDGRVASLSASGRVASVDDAVPQDLVRVDARIDPNVGGAVSAPMLPAVTVAAALTPDLVAVTDAVGVNDRGVVMSLWSGATAVVGDTTELTRKLQAVATLLSGKVDTACLGTIDVSVVTVDTLRRDPACTGATP